MASLPLTGAGAWRHQASDLTSASGGGIGLRSPAGSPWQRKGYDAAAARPYGERCRRRAAAGVRRRRWTIYVDDLAKLRRSTRAKGTDASARQGFAIDKAADLGGGGRPALPPHSTAAARNCHSLTEQVAIK